MAKLWTDGGRPCADLRGGVWGQRRFARGPVVVIVRVALCIVPPVPRHSVERQIRILGLHYQVCGANLPLD